MDNINSDELLKMVKEFYLLTKKENAEIAESEDLLAEYGLSVDSL
tara:strand:- start:44 stop:178 length:135 start_codon:yes stop_codon:yes gene_type:complete